MRKVGGLARNHQRFDHRCFCRTFSCGRAPLRRVHATMDIVGLVGFTPGGYSKGE